MNTPSRRLIDNSNSTRLIKVSSPKGTNCIINDNGVTVVIIKLTVVNKNVARCQKLQMSVGKQPSILRSTEKSMKQ